LLGRKNDDGDAADDNSADTGAVELTAPASGTTAPKGRPTPKRSDKRRGPVAPAPMTASEARQRRKQLRSTMSKEERKADKERQRAVLSQRRERMLAGDEDALLPRDRGPVRRYVRDMVDSRRNILGLFLPAALFIIVSGLFLPPKVQIYSSLLMPLFLVVMIVDGLLLARRVNKAVDAKFPANTETHFKLGLYAAGRASQLRRMRIPRPLVSPGATID
jgi:hypothetical protein